MEEIRIFLGTIERVKNFVNEVSHLECDVDIVSGRYVIDAKSIMGIFSLDLSKPLILNAGTEDEQKIKETFADFIGEE